MLRYSEMAHDTRRIVARFPDHTVRLVEEPVPDLGEGQLLVDVHASLISPGTELGGWHGLAARRKAVLAAPNDTATSAPRPFGYSNAGVVRAIGSGVRGFEPGDRVACIGGGQALHADVAVVGQGLCVLVPDAVSFDDAAYAMLLATALHGLRRGQPELGTRHVIAGLGLLGLLIGRVYQIGGASVIGWDTVGARVDAAVAWGFDHASSSGGDALVEATAAFADGEGLDGAVIAFGGDATDVLGSIERCLHRSPDGHAYGTIVVIGGASFAYKGSLTNVDIRRASRTGPGYHDHEWERDPGYPMTLVRWSTRAHLQLAMRLIAEARVPVGRLTTHRVSLAEVTAGIEALLTEPDAVLGVIIDMGR